MNSDTIIKLAKQSGFIQGPWATGNRERIWQENRDFPDALEVYTMLVVSRCVGAIMDGSVGRTPTEVSGMGLAVEAIEAHFAEIEETTKKVRA